MGKTHGDCIERLAVRSEAHRRRCTESVARRAGHIVEGRGANVAHLIHLAGGHALVPAAGEYRALFGLQPVVVTCRNGPASLTIEGGHWVVALCTRGELSAEAGDSPLPVPSRNVFVCSGADPLRIAARRGASWLLAIVPQALARQEARWFPPGVPATHPLFPSAHRRALRQARALFDLARCAAEGADPRHAVRELALSALDVQSRDFDELIARCPGRTLALRRDNFARLLHARQWVEYGAGATSIGALARRARYSRYHFIRIFGRVFGERPRDFVTRVRLARVIKLLEGDSLAISEAARSVGFDNRSSFARLFRRYYGMTATEYRREQLAARVQPEVAPIRVEEPRLGKLRLVGGIDVRR